MISSLNFLTKKHAEQTAGLQKEAAAAATAAKQAEEAAAKAVQQAV